MEEGVGVWDDFGIRGLYRDYMGVAQNYFITK